MSRHCLTLNIVAAIAVGLCGLVGEPVLAQESHADQFLREAQAVAKKQGLQLLAVLPKYPALDVFADAGAADAKSRVDAIDRFAVRWRCRWEISDGYLLLGPQYTEGPESRSAALPSIMSAENFQQNEATIAFLESLTAEQNKELLAHGQVPLRMLSPDQCVRLSSAVSFGRTGKEKITPDSTGYVSVLALQTFAMFSNGDILGTMYVNKDAQGKMGLVCKLVNVPQAVGESIDLGIPADAAVSFTAERIDEKEFLTAVASKGAGAAAVSVDARLARGGRAIWLSSRSIPYGVASKFARGFLCRRIRHLEGLCHVGGAGPDALPSEEMERKNVEWVRTRVRRVLGTDDGAAWFLRWTRPWYGDGLAAGILAARPFYRVELPPAVVASIRAAGGELRQVIDERPKVSFAVNYDFDIKVSIQREGRSAEGLGLAVLHMPFAPVDSLVGKP